MNLIDQSNSRTSSLTLDLQHMAVLFSLPPPYSTYYYASFLFLPLPNASLGLIPLLIKSPTREKVALLSLSTEKRLRQNLIEVLRKLE